MPDDVKLTPVPEPHPVISNKDFDRLVRRGFWMVAWRLGLIAYVIATLCGFSLVTVCAIILGYNIHINPFIEFLGLLAAIGIVMFLNILHDIADLLARYSPRA